MGLFTDSDWACDGSGNIEYTRTAGQFWVNGTYTAYLTEQLPGETFILSYDTYNIINQTGNNPGTIVKKPPAGGIGNPNPMKDQTDSFLSGGMFVALLMIMIFAQAGNTIGGFAGSVIGFGAGFIFASWFGLLPIWVLYLFAILIITAFAVMASKSLTNGGQG